METKRVASGNDFLDRLPTADASELRDRAHNVAFTSGQVVYEPTGRRFDYIYFPVDCLFSITAAWDDRFNFEVSSVSRNGLTGSRAVMGRDRPTLTTLCTVPGRAHALSLGDFMDVVRTSKPVERAILRYYGAASAAVGQRVVCNRFHSPDERTARWLLHAMDATQSRTIEIPQRLLGSILGLMRPAASAALGVLRDREAVAIRRKRIEIRSRRRLEAASCECYRAITGEFESSQRRSRAETARLAGR